MAISKILPPEEPPETEQTGWRHARVAPSLQEVYRTVPVGSGSFFRKLLAFAGPGYLVAVGYMDPGNWATDLAGGSRFGYSLLSVILLSNLMAVLLQGLASKLGIVTGRDLAQACRDHYSAARRRSGSGCSARSPSRRATLPKSSDRRSRSICCSTSRSPSACCITGFDVLLLLMLQNRGVRVLEALVITLIATVGLCFLFEIILARPDFAEVAKGFIPDRSDHHRSARCSTSPSASSARR